MPREPEGACPGDMIWDGRFCVIRAYGSSEAAPVAPSESATTPDVTSVDSVIGRNRWRFKACYNKALSLDPNAGGKVVTRIYVGRDGKVVRTEVTSTTASDELSQCVADAFAQMQFSEPEGGSATFNVPVVLSARK